MARPKNRTPTQTVSPRADKKRVHWMQAFVSVVLGGLLGCGISTIREHFRDVRQTRRAAWQVANAWNDDARINSIALDRKLNIAALLSTDPPEDVAQRNRFVAHLRSSKLSSFALKTMAGHFATLDAEGPSGAAVANAMSQFYRSLERGEKEEMDIFPQLACESSTVNLKQFATALNQQYLALEELLRRTSARVETLRKHFQE